MHISFNHGDTIGIAIYNNDYSYDYFDCYTMSTMITIALSFICVAEICQISIDSMDLCRFTHGIFQPQSQGSSVKVGLGDGIGISYGKMMWTGGEAALGHTNAFVCSTWNGPRVASCHFDKFPGQGLRGSEILGCTGGPCASCQSTSTVPGLEAKSCGCRVAEASNGANNGIRGQLRGTSKP